MATNRGLLIANPMLIAVHVDDGAAFRRPAPSGQFTGLVDPHDPLLDGDRVHHVHGVRIEQRDQLALDRREPAGLDLDEHTVSD